jgi:CubicO group peptidase (beta-lactamase class C family)
MFMKKLLLSLLVLLSAAQLVAQPSDAYLLNRMNLGKMPGSSLVVIKDGHWVYDRSLGQANIATSTSPGQETIYMLASISKTMIGTAIMQLWEKGLVDLEADINDYLPFQVVHPQHPTDMITVRMLVTHTASIQDNWNVMIPLYVYGDSPISLDSFMKEYYLPGGDYYSASDNFYAYAPGAQSNYSNMATTLAAYIVERVSGDLFSHYCDTAIFDKLCMENTSFLLAGIADTTKIARPYSWYMGSYVDNGLYGYPDYPDGQLRTTIKGLARFMTAYMQGGEFEGNRILDSSTVAYMLHQQTSVAWNQGIIFYAGLSSNGDTLWGHNGGDAGVSTAMYFSPGKKTGAIILTNGEGSGLHNVDLIADTLYKYGLTVTPSPTDTFPPCSGPNAIHQVVRNDAAIALFPNPNGGSFTIGIDYTATLLLTDMQGRLTGRYELQRGNNQLSLSKTIAEGVYYARFYNVRGEMTAVKKFIYMR